MISNRLLRNALLAVALTLLAPGHILAWGDHGHQIVVLIASRYLSDQARGAVLKLLAADIKANPNYYKKACPQVTALAQGGDKDRLLTEGLRCMVIWPDPPYVKYDRPYTANWHFVDIPLTLEANGKVVTNQFDLARECLHDTKSREKSGDCACLAVERFRSVLANPQMGSNYGEDDPSRAEALKFVIHIIGDIHQPLHSATDINLSKPNDRGDAGGNGKIVEWLGQQTYTYGLWNLHAVWDEGILDKTLEPYKAKDEGVVETAYINALKLPPAGSSELTQKQQGDIFAWTSEAYMLAAEYAYGKLPTFDANYTYPVLDRKTFKPVIDPQTNKPQTKSGGYRLTQSYYESSREVVNSQLALAGLRLARILNEALAH